jgi:hypothetical protein
LCAILSILSVALRRVEQEMPLLTLTFSIFITDSAYTSVYQTLKRGLGFVFCLFVSFPFPCFFVSYTPYCEKHNAFICFCTLTWFCTFFAKSFLLTFFHYSCIIIMGFFDGFNIDLKRSSSLIARLLRFFIILKPFCLKLLLLYSFLYLQFDTL